MDVTVALEERIAFAEMARDNVIAQLDELTGRVATLRAAHGERTSALVDFVKSLIKQLPAEAAASASYKLHEILRTSRVPSVAVNGDEADEAGPDTYTLACCEHARWAMIASMIESGFGRGMLKSLFTELAPYQQDFFFRAARSAMRSYNLLVLKHRVRNKEQDSQGKQPDGQ